jgi:membrane-bound lytic murein transglycosylase B
MRILKKIFFLVLIFYPKIISDRNFSFKYWHTPLYSEVIDSLKANGFKLKEIDSIFSLAELKLPLYPNIVENFKKTKISKEYLKRLSSDSSELFSLSSIKEGKDFLKKHYKSLSLVEKEFGVEKEIIVAIIRIESVFGKYCGNYYVFSVFNSIILTENSSDKLKKWAKKELVDFLVVCQKNNLDFLKIKGSYAGAIGYPQFLPSSYRKFAVDGNNDKIINLFDWDDSFASVANYLRKGGWKKNVSLEIKKRALYSYNHSNYYVLAVLKYANKIKN